MSREGETIGFFPESARTGRAEKSCRGPSCQFISKDSFINTFQKPAAQLPMHFDSGFKQSGADLVLKLSAPAALRDYFSLAP